MDVFKSQAELNGSSGTLPAEDSFIVPRPLEKTRDRDVPEKGRNEAREHKGKWKRNGSYYRIAGYVGDYRGIMEKKMESSIPSGQILQDLE